MPHRDPNRDEPPLDEISDIEIGEGDRPRQAPCRSPGVVIAHAVEQPHHHQQSSLIPSLSGGSIEVGLPADVSERGQCMLRVMTNMAT